MMLLIEHYYNLIINGISESTEKNSQRNIKPLSDCNAEANQERHFRKCLQINVTWYLNRALTSSTATLINESISLKVMNVILFNVFCSFILQFNVQRERHQFYKLTERTQDSNHLLEWNELQFGIVIKLFVRWFVEKLHRVIYKCMELN